MWACPKCGRTFTQSGQAHSCGPFSVGLFLQGKSAHERTLYRRFEGLALGVGKVVVAPAKTRIGFQRETIFAAVNTLARNRIDVHIVTAIPISSYRIRRVDELGPATFVNHATFSNIEEMDVEVETWLRLGYEWGISSQSTASSPSIDGDGPLGI